MKNEKFKSALRIKALIVLAVIPFCIIQAQSDSTTAKGHRAFRQHIRENAAQIKSLPRKERAKYIRHKADSLIDKHTKIVTDTNYVARPSRNWNIRLRGTASGNFIHIFGINAVEQELDYKFRTNVKGTMGITASYRGISLSLSISPTKVFGHNSDKEYNINYYGRKFGVDLQYTDVNSITVRNVLTDESMHLDAGYLRGFSMDGYWVFNNRRFSYPAVFNNSWIQKRSAGSWLTGLTFYVGQMGNSGDFSAQHGYTRAISRINMLQIGIGGGYAYNFVPNRHWLLHISAQPYILVWKQYTMYTVDTATEEEFSERLPMKFPEVFLLGRLGATYSWNRFYIGVNGMMQSTLIGAGADFHLRNSKWRASAYFGIRI